MTNKKERQTGKAYVLIVWMPYHAEDVLIKMLPTSVL